MACSCTASWTADSVVGLDCKSANSCFFAVKENSGTLGRIYSINPYDFVDPSKDESPFTIHYIKFLYPPVATRRIELQKGLFSVHPFPSKPAIIYDYGLTVMENAFYNFFHSHTNFGFEPYNNDPFQYQEDHYQSKKDKNICFNIPAYCKEYFEGNIRKLGIDEMIFGDIDSLSKHLIYQFKNGHLSNFKEADFKFAFPIIGKKIEEFVIGYFEMNSAKLTVKRKNNIVSPFIHVHINGTIGDGWNNRTVTGTIIFMLKPNLKGNDVLFETTSDINIFNKKLELIHENQNPKLGVLGSGYCPVEFKASLFWARSHFIDIKSIDLIIDQRMEQFINSCENSFEKQIDTYQNLSSIINLKDFEEYPIDSDMFKETVKKLREHFGSKKD